MIDKIFKQYGEDIKEYQWLYFLYEKTGKTKFSYEKELDPFLCMGWLKRSGDEVEIGEPPFVYEIFKEPPPKQLKLKTIKLKQESLKNLLGKHLEKPADFFINTKYEGMVNTLVGKFGEPLVMEVLEWYNENKGQLERRYSNLRFNEFCSHQVFKALNQWKEQGISPRKDLEEYDKIDYSDRVC